MEVDISKDELYSLVKEAVKEVFQEERLEFFMKSLPSVSKEEMDDIEKIYGQPPPDKEVSYSETIEI